MPSHSSHSPHWPACLIPAGLALLLPLLSNAGAGQLLESGGFERPIVKGRTSVKDGANPVKPGVFTNWQLFTQPPRADGKGTLTAGFTDEIARTGKQSLYVAFDGYTALNSGVALATQSLPIQKGGQYRISIWGRVDKKTPLTFDQRFPYLVLQVEFYTEDGETVTGDPLYKTQPLPDDPHYNRNRPPLFTPDTWSEYFVIVDAPADAAFVKIIWEWKVVKEPGTTTGVMYFDDATLEGPNPPEDDADAAEPATEPEAAQAKPAGNTKPGSAPEPKGTKDK